MRRTQAGHPSSSSSFPAASTGDSDIVKNIILTFQLPRDESIRLVSIKQDIECESDLAPLFQLLFDAC
jgi:hypothetical protein